MFMKLLPGLQKFRFVCGRCGKRPNERHFPESSPKIYTNKATFMLTQDISVLYFRAIGFFNEADTLESSSMLIYSFQEQSIYTQSNIN